MLKFTGDTGFPKQALFLFSGCRAQHFDGDLTLKLGIFGQIDRTLPAFGNLTNDFETTDFAHY
jgi:hypothetical protein